MNLSKWYKSIFMYKTRKIIGIIMVTIMGIAASVFVGRVMQKMIDNTIIDNLKREKMTITKKIGDEIEYAVKEVLKEYVEGNE